MSVSRTAGLLAIAAFGIVFLAAFSSNLDSHLATLHLSPQVQQAIDMQRFKLAGIQIPTNVSGGEQVALKRAIDASFVNSFRVIALIASALALASALSAWLLVGGKKPAPAESTAKESQAAPSGTNEQAPQISAN